MERIILDSYLKDKPVTWKLDPDSPKTQEFNRKILAVNAMYGWLYEQGILQKVVFELKDYSDITYFAFDAKDLAPYRKAMEQSGVKDAVLAAQHVFDVEYSPCCYSGAIELGWTMASYRDVDGCVGRSWECGLVQGLSTSAVVSVEEVLERDGVRAAVSAAFAACEFQPSDLTKDGVRLVVRPLAEDDREQVELLDEESGNDVAWGIDSEEWAWGVFLDNELVGYCTLGGADDHDLGYVEFKEWTYDSLCLCDLFVKEEHRGKGAASYLVEQVLEKGIQENESVFLTLLDDRLSSFYEKFGFKVLDKDVGVMVRDERPIYDKVLKKDFDQAFAHYSSIDKSMLEQRDYLFSHAEKLIECYESGIEVLDLIDVDCWVRYENLLGERLNYEEYSAVNAVLDGDPHDIEETDIQMISILEDALVKCREEKLGDKDPRTALDAQIAEASGKAMTDNSEKVSQESERDWVPF